MARSGRMNRDTRRRVMEYAAWRKIGHDNAYLIAFGPMIGRVTMLCALVAALVFMWLKVPHAYLGVGALLAGVGIAIGWWAWTSSHAALQRRMNARATGAGVRRGVGLGWAVACLVLLLFTTGYLSLWSPYA